MDFMKNINKKHNIQLNNYYILLNFKSFQFFIQKLM